MNTVEVRIGRDATVIAIKKEDLALFIKGLLKDSIDKIGVYPNNLTIINVPMIYKEVCLPSSDNSEILKSVGKELEVGINYFSDYIDRNGVSVSCYVSNNSKGVECVSLSVDCKEYSNCCTLYSVCKLDLYYYDESKIRSEFDTFIKDKNLNSIQSLYVKEYIEEGLLYNPSVLTTECLVDTIVTTINKVNMRDLSDYLVDKYGHNMITEDVSDTIKSYLCSEDERVDFLVTL